MMAHCRLPKFNRCQFLRIRDTPFCQGNLKEFKTIETNKAIHNNIIGMYMISIAYTTLFCVLLMGRLDNASYIYP